MKSIYKSLSILATLFIALLFVRCSKTNEETGNYVKLDNVSYAITSAVYFVDNGNLTIQFETADPDVFLYFKGKNTIPLGETNVSYESLDDNCIVTYCFETEDYLSIDGTVTISLNGGDYTVSAEGHVVSASSGDRNFKIHYVGDITKYTQGGSGNGGSGGGSQTLDRIWVSPAFSYYDKTGGNGRIDVYCDNDNKTWSAASNANWCQIVDETQGVGNGSISITISQNLSYVERTARITIKSGDGKTRSVYVIQHAGSYDMVVKPERLEFGAMGNTNNSSQIIHVYIYKPDTQWTATCDASWAHLSSTGGTSNTDIKVIVDKNTSTEERVAIVKFKSNNNTVRYVTLYQKGGVNGNFKVAVTNAEYQVQQNNNMVVKVRYYIKNQSSSYTLYYLKFSAKHPSGYLDTREIGSKTNTSQWTLAPGNGTYTEYFPVSFQYQVGNISGDILDYAYY